MSVIDTLLLSTYSFLNSANEETSYSRKDTSLLEFNELDDGEDEINSVKRENPEMYRYFTSTPKLQMERKAKRASYAADVAEDRNSHRWMKDENITIIE